MRYLGNKTKLANELKPILMKHLDGENHYIEPFVGACGMIQAIDYPKRIASDINPYIVSLMDYISTGGTFDMKIDEEFYQEVKRNRYQYPMYLVGFIGFGCSFGGKFFGGFARSEGRNLVDESLRNIYKLAPKLQGIKFFNFSYNEIDMREGNVIYCDIPYQGTTSYTDEFEYDKFWKWARDISKDNYLYISEYSAPDDFISIWEKEHRVGIDHNLKEHNKSIEKLFMYKG